MRKTFSQPPLVAIMILMFNNFFTIAGEDLGYIIGDEQQQVEPQPEQSGWFAH